MDKTKGVLCEMQKKTKIQRDRQTHKAKRIIERFKTILKKKQNREKQHAECPEMKE